MTGTGKKGFWETIQRFLKFMRGRAWWILLIFLFAVLTSIFNALMPFLMGRITDVIAQGISAGMTNGVYQLDFERIRNILLTLVLVYVGSAIVRFLQQFITTRVAQNTVYDLRKAIKEKMGRLPISFFDSHSNGDILSRAINDMDQVSQALGQTLTQITLAVVQLVVVVTTMLLVDWKMALVVMLAMTPLALGFIRWSSSRSQVQFAKRQNELGRLNDIVEEVYSGHSAVRIYNQEDAEAERFDAQSDVVNEAAVKGEFYAGVLPGLMGFSNDVTYTLVALIGGLLAINGQTTIGTVQSFLQYTGQYAQPFRALSNVASSIQSTVASLRRIFELLDAEEMVDPVGGPNKENTPYKVEFEHVQFGYGDDLLMTDFNLQVEEGEMVAIVGPTGAGKSTLINLLERFYDVKGGAIYYEGVDIRNMTREELRDNFAMVLQDTWVFNGTIWDNLKYGAGDVTEEQILAASKATHVHDFVLTLPKGYDTVLNEEGSNISQGQRQLITIARAFLQNPDVLILDEATSSVDTRTEVLIQEAIDKVLEGRTSFVIAHRLSTIREADKIIVMNQGDVIEAGNHDELIEKDGFYANLYNAQFA